MSARQNEVLLKSLPYNLRNMQIVYVPAIISIIFDIVETHQLTSSCLMNCEIDSWFPVEQIIIISINE